MRVLCGMLGLLALGLVSGTAVAGLSGTVGPGAITGTISVTTPSVTTPTVTVTLPVTTVTSPTTVPTLPVTVTVPVTTAVTVQTTTAVTTTPLPVTTTAPAVTTTAPRVTTTVPTVTSPVPLPVTTAPQATTAGPTDPGSTGTIPAPAARPGSRTATAPAPRPAPSASADDTWAGDAAIGSGFATPDRRTLVLTFRLDRSRPIRVTVLRVASGCRVVGSFGIPGRAGSNALRFDDTLGDMRLRAGVYEVRLQSPGAASRRIWVRISAARRLSIVAPQTRCATTGAAGPVGLGATWPPLAGSANDPGGAEGPRAGVAAARFARTGSEEGRNAFSPNGLASELSRNPFAILLLGLAALLVAIAAIPRGVIPAGRLGALVADRRVELVSVGATVFVTAVLTLALA